MASSVDAKLLKSTKFPPEFSQKVDMQKVNVEVMKKWIAGKIAEILNNDDDVVIELCYNLMEGARFPDVKKMQIQLTGFLDKDTAPFCKELWKLCLSAQSNPQGVPKELLEAKKLELIQEKPRKMQKWLVNDAKKISEKSAKQTASEIASGVSVAIVVVVDLEGVVETTGEVGVEDEAMIETENLAEAMTGSLGEAMGETTIDAAQDIPDLPLGVDPIPESEGRFEEMLTPTCPLDEVGRDVMKEEGCRNLNHPLRWQTRVPHPGLPLVHPREIAVVHYQGPGLLHRADGDPSPGHQTGAPIGAGEAGEEEEVLIVELVADHQLLLIPLARHHPNADEQRLIPSAHLHPQEDLVTAPSLLANLRQEDLGVTLLPDRDRLQLPDHGLPAVSPFAKFLAVKIEWRNRLLQSRSVTPPRRRRRPSKSRSRGGRDRKRRRSLERYEPAKRRRDTSSVSSPVDTKNRSADPENTYDKESPAQEKEVGDAGPANGGLFGGCAFDEADISDGIQMKMNDPRRQASVLRERLLKDKIKKMRKSSIDSTKAQANTH
ncbi:PWI domain-containing protein [Lachnellula occidentalis]|uniref:PWI domain-containing protein n=1 Tax=Lachnellula occidentalis TaxID=215460 RepID=A0A8H8RQW9_9HELO|nr:PWI domain-containing protein [Lachnellula occidentalis]